MFDTTKRQGTEASRVRYLATLKEIDRLTKLYARPIYAGHVRSVLLAGSRNDDKQFEKQIETWRKAAPTWFKTI
jgi:hypothetical protein